MSRLHRSPVSPAFPASDHQPFQGSSSAATGEGPPPDGWNTGTAALDETLDALPAEVDAAALRQRVLRDTCRRVRIGGPLYLLLWLTITLGSGFASAHPELVAGHALVFAATAVGRLMLNRSLDRLLPARQSLAETLFLLLTVGNALHWGTLTALAGIWAPMQGIERYMVLSLVGLTLGATVGLAIHPQLRLLFPVAILSPLLLSLPFHFDSERALVAALGVIFACYVFVMSRIVMRDYWRLLTASALLKRRARQLSELSLTDSLTGLRNRLHFDREYRREWQRAFRQQRPLAVLVIDLDRFKSLNDRYGHAFGDQCLQAVAQVLNHHILRPGDVAARFGGEEFAVLLTDTEAEGALAVAERLLAGLRGVELEHAGQRVRLTASIGVASTVPSSPLLALQLIQRADLAMYAAKNAGRDRAVCLDAAGHAATRPPAAS